MKTSINEKPLVAIVGPTASGKTGLAIDIATVYDGEIICADSRTIYRKMDIGTAKPSLAERRGILHHGLDILSPNKTYSASQFKRMAREKIDDINGRGKLPIIVGGSGLYLWAFLYDYAFPAGANNNYRRELEDKSLDWLVQELNRRDPEAYNEVDLKNKRRVIRAIETAGQVKTRAVSLPDNYVLVGLCPSFDNLEKNIKTRTDKMLEEGLIDEVKKLIKSYGPNTESLQSVGYKEVVQYLNGDYDLSEASKLICLHTRQLAKRQMTWFKRNKDIQWAETSEQAEQIIKEKMGRFDTIKI